LIQVKASNDDRRDLSMPAEDAMQQHQIIGRFVFDDAAERKIGRGRPRAMSARHEIDWLGAACVSLAIAAVAAAVCSLSL
jgi:hypothetical protein